MTQNKSSKKKSPAFGALPGFDSEPIWEAIANRDEQAAIDEMMFLFEEGHPISHLASVLLEAGLPVPVKGPDSLLPNSLLAIATSIELAKELPFEDTVLPFLQSVSLLINEAPVKEEAVENKSASIKEITTLLTGYRERWLSFATETKQPLAFHYVSSALKIIETCGIEFVPALEENLLAIFESLPVTEATNQTNDSIDEAEFKVAQAIYTLDDETQLDTLIALLFAVDGERITKEENQTIAHSLKHEIEKTLHILPLTKQLPDAQADTESLSLSDLPILIEFGKANAAMKFVRTWIESGGESDPLWGVLVRCAARVDAVPQRGMAMLAVAILERWYRSTASSKRASFVYAAASLLVTLPQNYRIAGRFREEDE